MLRSKAKDASRFIAFMHAEGEVEAIDPVRCDICISIASASAEHDQCSTECGRKCCTFSAYLHDLAPKSDTPVRRA
jgi:hypothetical protein